MRILVDQSGYDLLNLGDVAMLQACVGHLGALWPQAEIAVVCHQGIDWNATAREPHRCRRDWADLAL
jgi:polysaccharide pyruvyl transferase WcaK-like protein